MSLTYRRVNPLDHADSIKRLFVEQDRPEFPDWFDRAYPVLAKQGGSSWVGVDPAGQVQLHIATFPVRMSLRGAEIKTALFSNLMASTAHRSFLPAASLLRQAVRGMKDGGLDLVYAPPGNDGALAVVRAAGFTVIGRTARFAQITGDRGRLLHGAAGAMLAIRALTWAKGCRVDRCDIREAADLIAAAAAAPETVIETLRAPELYRLRLAGFGEADDIGFRIRDASGTAVGGALLRLDRNSRAARLVSIRCSSFRLTTGAVLQIGRQARALGMTRVMTNVLAGSARARALRMGGYFERPDTTPLAAQAFTDIGREALSVIGRSDIEDIDLD